MAMSTSLESAPVSPLPYPVRLGEVLAGKYRLTGILGSGGMGVVVGALHLRLDQRVAIKFMSPLLLYNEGSLERFLREARLAARIQCEHVVRVFDVASLDDGSPYIVMEHLEGEDLRSLLQRRGRLPIGEAVDCILQAGEAIAEAHVAGVVHRDLKPSNLFVGTRPDGSRLVKVLDFGISKLLRRPHLSQGSAATDVSTGRHAILGSPLYCSPEQIRASGDVDARTDLWSLGAILYELVSGTPPFSGATLLEIFSSVMQRAPDPLAARGAEVPPELEVVVARCLAKDRNQRFADIAELARALAPFAPGHAALSVERIENVVRRATMAAPVDSPPPVSRPVPPESSGKKTLPSEGGPSSGRRARGIRPRTAGRRWVAPVAVAAVASAMLGGTAAIVGASRRPLPVSRSAAPVTAATPAPAPSGVTALAPLREPPPIHAPSANPPSGSSATAPPQRPPARPLNPDTSGFGGLR
jgi:serine/threonine-protein kinase